MVLLPRESNKGKVELIMDQTHTWSAVWSGGKKHHLHHHPPPHHHYHYLHMQSGVVAMIVAMKNMAKIAITIEMITDSWPTHHNQDCHHFDHRNYLDYHHHPSSSTSSSSSYDGLDRWPGRVWSPHKSVGWGSDCS